MLSRSTYTTNKPACTFLNWQKKKSPKYDIIIMWRQLSALPGGLIPAGSYIDHHAFAWWSPYLLHLTKEHIYVYCPGDQDDQPEILPNHQH